MTSERDFDRIARAWLDLGPNEAPDRAIDAVLDAIETTPQARRSWRWPRWRSPTMTRITILAVLAGIIAITVGGLALSGGAFGPGPAPSVAPSPLASAAASPTPAPLPATVKGGWVAPSRGSALVDSNVATIALGEAGVNGLPSDFFVDRRGCCTPLLGSSITIEEPNVLRFTLDSAFGACKLGATGDYRWSTTADGQWLTLDLVDDGCTMRSALLAGTWQRSLAHDSEGGPGIATIFEPYVAFTLPRTSWVGRGLGDVDTIVADRDNATFKVWKDLDGFNDPCDINAGRKVLPPGMDGFLGYLNGDPRFTVDSQKEYTIDGHRAVEVAFTIGKDIKAPCWDFDGNAADKTGVLTWATTASDGGFWNAPINSLGLLVVTEVGDATLVFEAASGPDSNPTVDRSTLDTVRFLDALPTAPAS